VYIGKAARHVKAADALDYVAGYTVVNDITDRVLLWRKDDMKAMGTDWVSGKSSPSYLPTGPFLVPAAYVPDPQNLRITLKLNGEIKQDDVTGDMIHDVRRLIEYLSSKVQLYPGDLLCTGSPAGNGTHYNRFLRANDVVESSITGLGVQRNPVLAERN
jgi:2-keto-4-pentenoate hydratase/2-oxohepta-3-ene-1,7-dioic acid hydratase in catechol pathway